MSRDSFTTSSETGLPTHQMLDKCIAAMYRRLIGASGFQLINVNNVPLSLRGWSVDTRLIGRKALTNSLMRHYIAQAISEAHKVRALSTHPHQPMLTLLAFQNILSMLSMPCEI